MNYRRLTAADVDSALTMNTTVRPGFFTRDTAAAFLSDDRNWLFAAIDGTSVVGFAYGYSLLRPDGRTMLYIHEVGVTESRRRQGVASAMLRALFDRCRADGICRCFLFTQAENMPANALYRSLGGDVSPDSHGCDTAYFFQMLQ